jgi:hypothetical protein
LKGRSESERGGENYIKRDLSVAAAPTITGPTNPTYYA